MGYFSNGTEGDLYEAKYCSRCVHGPMNESPCTVWFLQLMNNYAECNNADSMLHVLIPREKPVGNGQCTMFLEVADE